MRVCTPYSANLRFLPHVVLTDLRLLCGKQGALFLRNSLVADAIGGVNEFAIVAKIMGTSDASRRPPPCLPPSRPSDPCASCEILPMVVLMPRRFAPPDHGRTPDGRTSNEERRGDIISRFCRSETPFPIAL